MHYFDFHYSWEQRKFSDLVQIERGGSPRPIDDFITDSPDGLNWVKIGDAPAQGNYITKTAEKIKPEGLSKTREVHPGDLILSNSMSFGKPYIMGIDGCIHDGWLLIRNTYKAFDLTFLCHLLGTPQMIIQYKSLAAGSTVNNLNKELVGNTVVTIPTIKEQRVLGQYLETLDNLITLHQCKCQIDGCRFQSPLAITWEQRKVTEIGKIYIGLVTTMTKHYTDEGTLLIRNSDIKDGKFEFGDNPIYLEKTFAEKNETRMHQIGDVITVHTGDVGTSAVITENEAKSIGFATIVTRPNPKIIDSNYLCSFLNTDKHKKWAVSISTGDGRTNYNLGDYFELVVPVPSIAEQKKIASYIQKLNRLITLHQREFAFLCKEKSKKFRYIKNAWEQRKLSEIATMHARIGWQNLRTSEFLDSGDYMLITGTDFIDGAVNFDTCHYVERERYEQDKHIQIRNGSILITKDGTLGKVAYIQGLTMPATLNAGVFNVEIKDENEVDNRYLFQYLKAPFLMDYVDKKATGGTIKHLNQNILVDFPVVLPHKAEQEKIGEYFLAIDQIGRAHV